MHLLVFKNKNCFLCFIMNTAISLKCQKRSLIDLKESDQLLEDKKKSVKIVQERRLTVIFTVPEMTF